MRPILMPTDETAKTTAKMTENIWTIRVDFDGMIFRTEGRRLTTVKTVTAAIQKATIARTIATIDKAKFLL